MSSKPKLKSTYPLAIFDHLLQFKRDMAWAPEHFPLKKSISLLLDSFKEPASNLVDRFRSENTILFRMSSLELVSNHLREHFCSDIFSQALELDYRNFRVKSTDKIIETFLLTSIKSSLGCTILPTP